MQFPPHDHVMSGRTLEASRLFWPANWPKIFGRTAPLLFEIGFGNADFLLQLALENPKSNVLGLEISLPSLRRGERKLDREDLPYAKVLRAEAHHALWTLCRPGEVDAVFINFPDPWPKDSHRQRRLISDRFIHLVGTRMALGGQIRIATDHAEYAEWIARTTRPCAVVRQFDAGQLRQRRHSPPRYEV